MLARQVLYHGAKSLPRPPNSFKTHSSRTFCSTEAPFVAVWVHRVWRECIIVLCPEHTLGSSSRWPLKLHTVSCVLALLCEGCCQQAWLWFECLRNYPLPYQLLQTSQGKRGGGGVEAGVVTGTGQSVTEMGKSN